MDGDVAFTATGELGQEPYLFWAELRDIRSKFLSAQLLEYYFLTSDPFCFGPNVVPKKSPLFQAGG